MTARKSSKQAPEVDPAGQEWIALRPLYPALPGAPATMPVPAYQTGARVPWPEVERNGWHDGVAAASGEQEPPDAHASAEAASGVHPVVAAHVAAAEEDPAEPAADEEEPPSAGDSSPTLPPPDAGAQGTQDAAPAAGKEE